MDRGQLQLHKLTQRMQSCPSSVPFELEPAADPQRRRAGEQRASSAVISSDGKYGSLKALRTEYVRLISVDAAKSCKRWQRRHGRRVDWGDSMQTLEPDVFEGIGGGGDYVVALFPMGENATLCKFARQKANSGRAKIMHSRRELESTNCWREIIEGGAVTDNPGMSRAMTMQNDTTGAEETRMARTGRGRSRMNRICSSNSRCPRMKSKITSADRKPSRPGGGVGCSPECKSAYICQFVKQALEILGHDTPQREFLAYVATCGESARRVRNAANGRIFARNQNRRERGEEDAVAHRPEIGGHQGAGLQGFEIHDRADGVKSPCGKVVVMMPYRIRLGADALGNMVHVIESRRVTSP
ncbi:hypothetical protein B0H17DRAFT_1135410 [Mycena rosella]|uniref:Uncharacterized protein n=1 Tax=Mycena rosella TaxID=1033263 RepID=A0AAD7DDP7_MYCRO|nr:hypothetical protein B0H17DRAFT_1135410 [Mycena rosella]